MYGDLGQKLVHHAKRTQTLHHLPSYQSEVVRAVTREVRDLDREVTEMVNTIGASFDPSSDPGVAYTLLVRHLCLRRNKRCLLVYHHTRLRKIEGLCWAGGGLDALDWEGSETRGVEEDIVAGDDAEGQRHQLSPEEEEYARQYTDLLAAAKGQWTDVDLTGSLEPPRDLFIDVRVLKDAGEIQTEYGAINLTKNSQFYVRQGDVERLIQQGFLQKLG
ncbi:GINS complex, Psf1 component [Ascodesmis nigricans]|uniref:DNA replication complex GINS protein PSF1 n=1 Tax=Ascodesmis nigricans TaxID=341454 RepID=A0A4S2N2M8_9PEZI|nr:GINS complex, Psf1 component [Ascodesmis nigricans]